MLIQEQVFLGKIMAAVCVCVCVCVCVYMFGYTCAVILS